MPALVSGDRIGVGAAMQSDTSILREPMVGVLKTDIQAAVVAVDDWLVANMTSFNAALPTAARTGLTAPQKARLLMYVIQKRYSMGS